MLKKIIFAAVLIVFSASISYSQNLSLGLKAGGSIVDMSFEGPAPSSVTHFGFSFGASAAYKVSPVFSLESGLIYSRKGTMQSNRDAVFAEMKYNDEYIYKLDYISVPLLAKLFPPVEWAFKPHAEMGASLNFLAKSELEFNNDPQNPYGVRHMTTDMTSETNSFDLGILFGLGVDYQLESGIISLETRYDMGLTNVDKGIGSGPIKNSALSLIAGYSIVF